MGLKHMIIAQLDGALGGEEDVENERYLNTERYWKTGILATSFQSYLDANYIIDESDLTEEDKIVEKESVLEARKKAFGENYIYYPPWRKF